MTDNGNDCEKKHVTQHDKDQVSRNAVYREFYEEMRRFRDYEFTSSTWFNASLLALLSFCIFGKFGDSDKLSVMFEGNSTLPYWITFAGFLITFAAVALVLHCAWRYDQLRTWCDKELEPSWKTFPPKAASLEPRYLILSTPVLIYLAVVYILWILK